MAGPVVELFSTSILSNVKVRTRHERFTSVLAIKKVPYVYHDLASDDDAKSRWRRKAKDPQLPGILVNNEWVGSFDEFEEAVEFGELELFLGVAPAAAQSNSSAPHPAQSAVSSKDPSLYPTLPYAAEGYGRWKEPDADQFISSLNIKDDELNDEEVDAMLADLGRLPSVPATSTSEKKYVPSKEAAIKPLRLAKMGPTTSHQRMPSGSPSPSTAITGTRASPLARYSATQRSTKALAAEAEALTSNRKTSGALLRDAVSQGKTLDDAMEQSRMKHIVSQDNIDDLFASLGLSNVDIGDHEVEQFLEQGAIPQGLRLGGDRVHRASSIADKARDQAVAKDLALKARERTRGSARTSLSNECTNPAHLQPATSIETALDNTSNNASALSVPTSDPPSQATMIAEGGSEVSEAQVAEDSNTSEARQVELDRDMSIKSDQDPTPIPAIHKSAEEKTPSASKPDLDATAEVVAEQMYPSPTASSGVEDSAATDESSDLKASKADIPGQTTEALISAKEEETRVAEQSIQAEAAHEKPTRPRSTASITAKPSSQRADSIRSTFSKASSSKIDDESGSAVMTLEDESENQIESSATLAADLGAPSPLASEVPTADAASEDDSTKASNATLPAQIDEQHTPTNEISATEPRKDELIQPTPAAVQREPDVEDEDFERELAQAAMIASRYEDRRLDVPMLQEPSENISSDVDTANSTSMDAPKSPSRREPVNSFQPSEEAGSGSGRRSSASRQASLSPSARRAIDVSRPIVPAALRPASPSTSAEFDAPMTPDSLARKKKGLRGFGLGRDKEKDQEHSSINKTAASSKPGAGASRGHERTISEILREADAVLQSDDYEGDSNAGHEDDDTEDSAMFGGASVDVDAGPAPILRGSSHRV